MSDILDHITAIHSQEERYEKLELLYRSEEEKKKILDAVGTLDCRRECQLEISTIDEGSGHGIVSVEFHDDYDKEGGPFFEKLIRKLGIDRCE